MLDGKGAQSVAKGAQGKIEPPQELKHLSCGTRVRKAPPSGCDQDSRRGELASIAVRNQRLGQFQMRNPCVQNEIDTVVKRLLNKLVSSVSGAPFDVSALLLLLEF